MNRQIYDHQQMWPSLKHLFVLMWLNALYRIMLHLATFFRFSILPMSILGILSLFLRNWDGSHFPWSFPLFWPGLQISPTLYELATSKLLSDTYPFQRSRAFPRMHVLLRLTCSKQLGPFKGPRVLPHHMWRAHVLPCDIPTSVSVTDVFSSPKHCCFVHYAPSISRRLSFSVSFVTVDCMSPVSSAFMRWKRMLLLFCPIKRVSVTDRCLITHWWSVSRGLCGGSSQWRDPMALSGILSLVRTDQSPFWTLDSSPAEIIIHQNSWYCGVLSVDPRSGSCSSLNRLYADCYSV